MAARAVLVGDTVNRYRVSSWSHENTVKFINGYTTLNILKNIELYTLIS